MDDEDPEHRDSHASSSREHLWSLRLREVWIWVSTVFVLTSERQKLRDLPETKNYKGPMQKTQMAEPYLVQKNLVT